LAMDPSLARAAAPLAHPEPVLSLVNPPVPLSDRERARTGGGTAIASLRDHTRRGNSTARPERTAMHIKGVLLALAVAARVAILVPAAGLAWLIWQR
jgi:hypothetical protein